MPGILGWDGQKTQKTNLKLERVSYIICIIPVYFENSDVGKLLDLSQSLRSCTVLSEFLFSWLCGKVILVRDLLLVW